MTPKEQVEFVNQLANAIRDGLSDEISAGKIPAEWNGIELRWLLAERFRRAVYSVGGKKRKAAYNNTVLVNNL